MATHSSVLAWKIPWTEEPGRLQSMGPQRVGRDGNFTSLHFKPSKTPVVSITISEKADFSGGKCY